MTSALFSPLSIRDLALDNRIVVSPMCQYSADDGVANDWHMTHLGMLSNSGASLVVIEATAVERLGRITHGCFGLYSDACEVALARVLRHCRHIGTAKFCIQIGHAGRKASSQRPWEGGLGLKDGEDPWETVAPSPIPFGAAWPAPRAITETDLVRIRDAFVAAAQRAVRAGIDAIELHMAHGYLVHSFVSPISNKRNDAYGGPFAARIRFPLEILRAVRAAFPAGMPLGARITGSDWVEGGLTQDDAVAFVNAMKGEGLDFVCVSSGGVTADTRNPTHHGYNVAIAEQVKKETGVLTRAVGLITAAQQAEAIIAEGKADLVALGRAMLDQPHWGWQAARELGAEARRPVQYLRVGPKMWQAASVRS
jgi:2,4-dienoyl-CoA reductase-like NADH-dependent reductase (Old Yellow Enzyme family)